MTTTPAATAPAPATPTRTTPTPTPTRSRRAALAVTGLLAALVPVTWTTAVVVELVTGTERDHLYHQLTGQGLMLGPFWALPVLLLVATAWRGRPSRAAAAQLLVVVLAGTAATALGAQAVASMPLLLGVPAALLWLALPDRPRLRDARLRVSPLLLPLAAVATGPLLAYAVGQAELQAVTHDEHMTTGHYFDMAWTSIGTAALMLTAALSSRSRLHVGTAAALLALLGLGGLVTPAGVGPVWSTLALLLAAAFVAAGEVERRRPGRTA